MVRFMDSPQNVAKTDMAVEGDGGRRSRVGRHKCSGDRMALPWLLHLYPLLSWEVGDATLIHWVSQPISTLSLSPDLQFELFPRA